MDCGTCGKPLGSRPSAKHDCGCRSHALCLDEDNPDFGPCARCKGELQDPSAGAEGSWEEPVSLDGRDYILDPVPPQSFVGSAFQSMFNKQSKQAKALIRSHTPVRTELLDKHHLSLQHLLSYGITMQDFLNAGYTWKELSEFRDLSGPARFLDALVALQCNAEHFRDYGHLIPFEEVSAVVPITGVHLVEQFGLHFPMTPSGDAPLQVLYGKNDPAKPWTADTLLRLGFTAEHMMGSGLQHVNQLIHSRLNGAQDLIRLGFRAQDLRDLGVDTVEDLVILCDPTDAELVELGFTDAVLDEMSPSPGPPPLAVAQVRERNPSSVIPPPIATTTFTPPSPTLHYIPAEQQRKFFGLRKNKK